VQISLSLDSLPQGMTREKLTKDEAFLKAVKIGLASKMGISADQAEKRIQKVLITFLTPKTVKQVVGEIKLNIKSLPAGTTRKELIENKDFRKAVKAGLAKELGISLAEAEKKIKIYLTVSDELSLVQYQQNHSGQATGFEVKVKFTRVMEGLSDADFAAVCRMKMLDDCPATAITHLTPDEIAIMSKTRANNFNEGLAKLKLGDQKVGISTGSVGSAENMKLETEDIAKSAYAEYIAEQIRDVNSRGKGDGSGTFSFLQLSNGGAVPIKASGHAVADESMPTFEIFKEHAIFLKIPVGERSEKQVARGKKEDEDLEKVMVNSNTMFAGVGINPADAAVITEKEVPVKEEAGDGDGSGSDSIRTFFQTGSGIHFSVLCDVNATNLKLVEQADSTLTAEVSKTIVEAVSNGFAAGTRTRGLQKTLSSVVKVTVGKTQTKPVEDSSFSNGGGEGSGNNGW